MGLERRAIRRNAALLKNVCLAPVSYEKLVVYTLLIVPFKEGRLSSAFLARWTEETDETHAKGVEVNAPSLHFVLMFILSFLNVCTQ